MHRLAIITTHPIQYNAPFFRTLAQSGNLVVKVFYTWDKGSGQKHDPGFGRQIAWDIPLLEGYDYTFVKNTSNDPGSHHFQGIRNPTLINEIKAFQPDAILVYGWSFHSHLRAMRHFKGKIPIWFRGDSTLLDYDYRSLKDVFETKSTVRNPQSTVKKALMSYIKFRLRKLFLTWVYKHMDKAFYVGTNNKSYFLTHGLKEKQLVWMPHAVDNEFFQKDEDKAEAEAKEWRAKLGIREDEFVVLFAGKFEPKKNPELLVRAVIEMNEEIKGQRAEGRRQKTEDRRQKTEVGGPNTVVTNTSVEVKNEVYSPQSTVHSQKEEEFKKQKKTSSNLQIFKSSNQPIHLIMVGNGVLENRLKEMASKKNYIHFLPFQNQTKMPVVYRLGNVFCLPSKGPGETWGLAVNEAMACGMPIIASTKVGCCIDLIRHGETGFSFQSNSIEDLKTGLAKSTATFNSKKVAENCKKVMQAWSYKRSILVEQFK